MGILADQSRFQDRWQGRSVVVSRDGIVAAESPLAAQAGAQVLARGGHAVDAAVAANAVMCVVAPHSNGIGGDLFAMVYEARDSTLHGLNASGWSPARLSIQWLAKRGVTEMPVTGIHTTTVPGTVDGWDKLLTRFGRMRFPVILAAAIHYAEEGFPVTEWSAQKWLMNQALQIDPNALHTLLPEGQPPVFGDIFRNSDLAQSLRRIACDGRDAFYLGEIARRIIESSERHGGSWTLDDLSEFSSEWVQPISTTYRGWTVYELPPNGSGVAALSMLNIAENFPMKELGHNTAESLHVLIEAKKLAYADLLRHVCDPRSVAVPVTELLSKRYAKSRSASIDMARASSSAERGQPLGGSDTTYLSVVDREGNMASLIQSNYMFFGSGLVPEQCGFVLQNRGNLFSMDPTHPNSLAGRKRPLHTIIPAMMSKDDVRISFGIQGGWNQSQAHAQFVSNVVDHGMNIQAALDAPRFTKISFGGYDVQLEEGISLRVRQELSNRGHLIEKLGAYSDTMGGGQAVMRRYLTGVNYGASDPRKDGAAVPEPWVSSD